MQDAFFIGLRDVVGDVGRERGFTHRRTTREDQKVGLVQAAELFIQVDQTGRDTRQAAIALIGGVGDVHGIGDGAQEGLKAAFCCAAFGKGVKRLFGLDNLVLGFGRDIDL